MEINSIYIYRFLGTVWDNLPTEDRKRFAELWKGYEQVFGEQYQHLLELGLSNNINTIPTYAIQRWNKYIFETPITEPITFISKVPLFNPVDLSSVKYIRFRVVNPSARNISLWTDVNCQGNVPSATTIDEIINKINAAYRYPIARSRYNNTLIEFITEETSSGVTLEFERYTTPSEDATTQILGLGATELPLSVPEYPYQYLGPSGIQKIPNLQDSIRNENLTYFAIDGLDFKVNPEKSRISFRYIPPKKLWAASSYFNINSVYYNYGYSVNYWDPLQSAEAYAETVKAIWFAYWHGPRPLFMQQALYLMFGLPVSKAEGIVNKIIPSSSQNHATSDYSGIVFTATNAGPQGNVIILTFDGTSNIGAVMSVWNTTHPYNSVYATGANSIVLPAGVTKLSGGSLSSPSIMEIIHIDETVVAYMLPEDLLWRVKQGDFVQQLQPLCTGIDIYDKVSLPHFVATEIGYGFMLDPFALPNATRGPGDTDETKAIDMLQAHTYLPQIDVNAFIRPGINLGNAMDFLRTLQPLHKTFQFQISVIAADATEGLEDFDYFDITIDITPNLEINQTNSAPLMIRDEYEILGIPRPALDLDSDCMAVTESGTITVADITGPLPSFDVVWT